MHPRSRVASLFARQSYCTPDGPPPTIPAGPSGASTSQPAPGRLDPGPDGRPPGRTAGPSYTTVPIRYPPTVENRLSSGSGYLIWGGTYPRLGGNVPPFGGERYPGRCSQRPGSRHRLAAPRRPAAEARAVRAAPASSSSFASPSGPWSTSRTRPGAGVVHRPSGPSHRSQHSRTTASRTPASRPTTTGSRATAPCSRSSSRRAP